MIHKLRARIPPMNTSLSITYSCDSRQAAAQTLANKLQLACVAIEQADTDLVLNFGPDFLELKDIRQNISIHVDFLSGALAHRRKYGGGKGQAIAKAIGFKQGTPPPSVLDATAGLGKDAFVMACLGCAVTLLERSPIVAAR